MKVSEKARALLEKKRKEREANANANPTNATPKDVQQQQEPHAPVAQQRHKAIRSLRDTHTETERFHTS